MVQRSALLLLSAVSFFGLACSDNGDPGNSGDGSRDFQGTIDPSAGTFVLESIDSTTVDGVRIRVDLIGSNLEVDPDSSVVALDVRIRNSGNVPLYAPGEIGVERIEPPTVWPINADRSDCLPCMRILPCCTYAFDYSNLLGDDSILSPNETSGAKRWRFNDPGLHAFSFLATAKFGLGPDRPRIEGTVFADKNANGHRDEGEPGAGGGHIVVNGPDTDSLIVQVPPDGHYAFPVTEGGLYSLLAVPPPTFAPVHATTPNPLQVLLPPGESYLHADFGFANDQPPPPGDVRPIGFWEGPPDSLPHDPYGLKDVHLEGTILVIRVGFSGCSPDQPFALFMLDGFELLRCYPCPPRAHVVLSHDSRNEMCEAYFERSLRYDLAPILARFKQLYGHEEQIEVLYHDAQGEIHSFFIGPVSSTSG
jgi:hypothetical protein